MFKHKALAIFCTGLAFGQVHRVQEHSNVPEVKCLVEVPKGYVCAIFFSVAPPLPTNGIASVVPPDNNFPPPPTVIREVSVILDGTLYTAAFDPPLTRDGALSRLRPNVKIPARIDGENLILKWPDGREAKAKIIRRGKINPNQPQPA